MRSLDKLRLRLQSLFGRKEAEHDLDAELQFHLDQLTREFIDSGLPPHEARQAAQRQFGGLTQLHEECLDMRRVNLVEDLVQDLRLAFRSLARSPAFTATVVATLALGIGANTAIFTIAHGVLLRPLEYPNPGQLMELTAASPLSPAAGAALSAPEYQEFRRINRSFTALGAFSTGGSAYTTGEVNLTAAGRPLRLRSIAVDAALLRTLGIQPEHGRLFTPEETTRWTGTLPPPVAMLSHQLWRTAFDSRPVSQLKVEIEGRSHSIVGILPPEADVMDNHTQVWLPLWLHPNLATQREAHVLTVIGRLKDDVTAGAAQAELNTMLQSWAGRTGASGHLPTLSPLLPSSHSLQLRLLQDAIVGTARRPIWVLQVAVAFVLLIVCANLANLVLARGASRKREFVLRTALGASRFRLLRQTVTEGAVLSLAGGALGLWLAGVSIQWLTRAYPASIPRAGALTLDAPVLLVTLGLSAAVALLFGLLSIGRGASPDLSSALKQGAKASSGLWRHYARRALVIAQVACAVLLVIGAGLLIQTVYHLTTIDSGFDRTPLLTFSLTLPMANSEPDTRAQSYQRVLDKLRAVPGVLGAAAMSGLPPHRTPDSIQTPIENHASPDGRPFEVIDYYQFVMGDYFRTMGIPIVAGHGFEDPGAASTGKTAIINETLSRRIFPGRNPIGQRLRPPGGSFGADTADWHTIIGVARDVPQRGVNHSAGTELYVSLDQHRVAPPSLNVVLRTALPPAALAATIERVIQEVDAAVPVVRLRPMDSVFAESIGRPSLLARLLGAFAGLALLLAAIGTYGVLSCIVTERRREIGIRVALGASRSEVLTHILQQGLQITAWGLALGLASALVLNRLLASLLFGVQPADSLTIAVVLTTITAVALLASWLPAWRASRLDPNIVLRDE